MKRDSKQHNSKQHNSIPNIVAVIVEHDDGSLERVEVCVYDLIDLGAALDQHMREETKAYLRRHKRRTREQNRRQTKDLVKTKPARDW